MAQFHMVERGGTMVLERPGRGTPLVMVPGVMADAASWRPVADAIEGDGPVMIVNRRGRAPSRDLGADYGLPVEIADLTAFLALVDEPVHLFGWSYGGLIALEAAVAGLPLRSLVAYEPVSRPFAPETVAPIRAALARGDGDRAVEIVNMDVSGFDRAYVEALRRAPAWPDLRRLATPLGEELAAIDRFAPSYARYADIEAPVTLILGELNEGRAPYGEAFDRFVRALPDAAIRRLPAQGHLAHVEAPALLAHTIADTLANQHCGGPEARL